MVHIAGLSDLIARQRGRLFLWVPICLAVGISIYFNLSREPSTLLLWGLAAVAAVLALGASRAGETAAPLLIGLALVISGTALAGWRANSMDAPVLEFRYYGPVEGRIVAIDRSISDRIRITLDRVVLRETSPDRTPARVRVALHGDVPGTDLRAGLLVGVTAHLSPPAGPVEPGGFDFQRLAWFKKLGAVGYSRTPVIALAPPEAKNLAAQLFRIRLAISQTIRDRFPGQTGAFAAAILTGDRSGLSRETLDTMRATNLAHLLAISGLHLGLLTGFVFAIMRGAIALIPPLAMRVPAKKWAALVALPAAAAYLALSGGNVATQRAFIMAAVMLCAVLLDKRAFTLRAVALAAIIVLVLRPETLTGPGFQMSFAATTALVAVFGFLRDVPMGWMPNALRPVFSLVVSSAVAGFATAPVAAAHFNQWASYGLVANLLSVPVMGSLVIPSAVVAAMLAPLGLSGLGLGVMSLGIDWILFVAHQVARLEGAVKQIVSPSSIVLPLLAIGALWGGLLRGGLRWLGPIACLIAFALWTRAERPDLLISENGALVGVMTAEGRALNKKRGDGFSALSWLENDGDAADQEEAWLRGQIFETGEGFAFSLGRLDAMQMSGRQLRDTADPCFGVDLLIAAAEPPPGAGCPVVLAPEVLAVTGPIAVWMTEDRLHLRSARAEAGDRLWNSGGLRRDRDIAPGDVSDRLSEVLAALSGNAEPEVERAALVTGAADSTSDQ